MTLAEAWKWAGDHLNIPSIVLTLMLAFSAFVMWRAQRRDDFDFGQMLKDDAGKESAVRLGVIGSFAVSSWVVMNETIAEGSLDPQLYWAYLFTWSGALVFVKAVEKWDGHLPWSKP